MSFNFNSIKNILSDNFKFKEETIYVVGFSTWKTYLRKYFSDYNLVFIDKNISEKEFMDSYFKSILEKNKKGKCKVFIWGFKAPQYLFEFLVEYKIKVLFVEDGFLRSINLGASKAPPMSLTLDSKSPYFDSTKETDLENLLNNLVITDEMRYRGAAALEMLVTSRVSKYNQSGDISAYELYGEKNKKRVLVIGQVEDDLSIKFGSKDILTNNDLVKIARKENPNANIFYKPHPDVALGYRKKLSNPQDVKNICTIINKDISLNSVLDTIDHVYTITSLAGFEALCRGIKVTTLGAPFYSGWGLTDDRYSIKRRKRKLNIVDLFYISYIHYPKYFDPDTGNKISIEDTIIKLKEDKGKIIHAPTMIKNTPSKSKVLPKKKTIKNEIYFDPSNLNQKALDHFKAILENKDNRFQVIFDSENNLGNKAIIKNSDKITTISINVELLNSSTIDGSFLKGQPLVNVVSENDEDEIHFINVSHYKINNDFYSLYYHYKDSGRANSKSLALYGLRAGIYNKSVLDNALLQVFQNYASLNSNEKELFFSKLYRIYGPRDVMEKVVNIYNKDFDGLSLSNQVKVICLLCEAGEYSKSLERVIQLDEKRPDIWKKSRILAISNLLYSNGLVDELWAKEDSDNYNDVIMNTSKFESYCRTYELNIVGNSPCEINSKRGQAIDSGNKVVRFNSANTYYPHNIDYGNITNVLVVNPRYFETERNIKTDLDFVVLSDADIYNTKQLSSKINDFKKYAQHVAVIPSYINYSSVLKVSASPSSGLKILFWLYKIRGPLVKDNIYGFSMTDQSHGTATSYSSSSIKIMNTIHDWASEKEVFSKIVQ